MKKSTSFFNYVMFLFSMLFVLPNVSAVNSHLKKAPASDEFEVLSNLSAEEFLDLSAKDLQKLIGKELRFKDKIGLRLAQRNVKKLLKKEASINSAEEFRKARRGFNILGFLLGLVLGPIGILLAWIFVDDGLRSSLIGFLFFLALGTLGILSRR